jgi:hypothetical protein
MIASLICVISVAAFLQFYVFHCRSILATSLKMHLSDRVREVTGMASANVIPDDFHRLLQLVRLCPERGDDQMEIRAVGTYYTLLRVLGAVSRRTIPSVAAWAEEERRSCSYFAAVALDRRISYSCDLFSQQVADSL